jgi:hypothetical protein
MTIKGQSKRRATKRKRPCPNPLIQKGGVLIAARPQEGFHQ